MANFNTELTPAQGAGSAVVAPVQEQVVGTGIGNLLEVFSNALGRSQEAKAKEEAEARKNAVLSEYKNNEAVYASAMQTGAWSSSQALGASRANFLKMITAYPGYDKELKLARENIYGGTDIGEAQETVNLEKQRREKSIDLARSQGFPVTGTSSQAMIDASVKAAQEAVRIKEELAETRAAATEKRAQGSYDATVAKEEAKQQGFQIINRLAAVNMEAFNAYAVDLAGQVKGGKDPSVAKSELALRFGQIRGTMLSAAGVNPELAQPYIAMFNDLSKLATERLNPENDVKLLQAQYDALVTKAKLFTVSNDSKVLGAVATLDMFKNSPDIALKLLGDGTATRALTLAASVGVNSGGFVPPIVGDASVEDAVYPALKNVMSQLNGGKAASDKAITETGNATNNLLKQMGSVVGQGQSATSLSKVAAFIASSEFGEYSKKNKLDANALSGAKKTFEIYASQMRDGVQSKLEGVLFNPGGSFKPTDVGSAVEVTFTGSGVQFTTKRRPGMLDIEINKADAAVKELNTSARAVTQLIHMGAHLEGSTDYAKHWEDNKHIYMPQVFPDPKLIKVGDVVNNMKYTGGAYGDVRNWVNVNK